MIKKSFEITNLKCKTNETCSKNRLPSLLDKEWMLMKP